MKNQTPAQVQATLEQLAADARNLGHAEGDTREGVKQRAKAAAYEEAAKLVADNLA